MKHRSPSREVVAGSSSLKRNPTVEHVPSCDLDCKRSRNTTSSVIKGPTPDNIKVVVDDQLKSMAGVAINSRINLNDWKAVYNTSNDTVKKRFNATCFRFVVDYEFPHKDNRFIAMIMPHFVATRGVFSFNGVDVAFTADHVRQITGIECGEQEINLKGVKRRSNNGFRRKYFKQDDPKIKRAREAIIELRNREDYDEEAMEDESKLLILMLFGTFLFTHANQAIYPALFEYTENLDTINQYAWDVAIHQCLLQGFEEGMARILTGKGAGFFKGCSPLLTVWAWEVFCVNVLFTGIMYPITCRWASSKTTRELLLSSNIDLNNLTEESIRSNAFERRTEGSSECTSQEPKQKHKLDQTSKKYIAKLALQNKRMRKRLDKIRKEVQLVKKESDCLKLKLEELLNKQNQTDDENHTIVVATEVGGMIGLNGNL